MFTEQQMTQMSQEIDRQLNELSNDPDAEVKGGTRGSKKKLPKKQADIIEQAAKEPPKTFIQKFRIAAKQDLCEEGGVLFRQWKKWGDLSNKDVLKQFGVILVAMGFSGNALQILAVSLAVVVLHLGVKAFCMEEEAAV